MAQTTAHVDEIVSNVTYTKPVDRVVAAAFQDGWLGFPGLHLFSAAEARSCLRGKRVVMLGDSYTIQTYIGLSDILLGTVSNREFRERNETECKYDTPRLKCCDQGLCKGSIYRSRALAESIKALKTCPYTRGLDLEWGCPG